MRKRRSNDDSKGGANWMDTYGDMVTLILTFFVLLYSFSSVNSDKWQELVVAFGGSKGVLNGGTDMAELPNQSTLSSTEESDSMIQSQQGQDALGQSQGDGRGKDGQDDSLVKSQLGQEQIDGYQQAIQNSANLYAKIKEYIESNNLGNDVTMQRTETEILIRFTNNVLFDSGKANLKTEGFSILNEISNAMSTYNNSIRMIRIEGHTDNLPISTREFPSNWELSTNRAVNVLRYLIEENNISPKTVSAVGYGEYHPIADNSTEEGRKINRRVDFVINVTK